MLSDIRLRYKRLVWINFPFSFLCRTASFDNQRLKKKCVFYWKKEFQKFGVYVIKQYFCTRFRERNADEHWNDEKEMRVERPIKKTFWKKLRKSFGGSKIVLTFASAFAKKAIKKSSLKDLDINKQVVQELTLCKQQKPSITLTS